MKVKWLGEARAKVLGSALLKCPFRGFPPLVGLMRSWLNLLMTLLLIPIFSQAGLDASFQKKVLKVSEKSEILETFFCSTG